MADKARRMGHMYLGRNLRMLDSPAWRALSDNGRRVVERLEIQHMLTALKENGRLCCTYDDFERAGVRRASIRLAIEEAVALGFVEVTRRGYSARMEIRVPSLYRLTYVKTNKDKQKPTDEWLAIVDDREARDALRKALASLHEERADKRERLAAKKAAAEAAKNAGKGVSPGRGTNL